MQVRNSLQSKKQQNPKYKKNTQYEPIVKQKKRTKTLRTQKNQKSKSRSKSNNEKQNIKNKKVTSKSKQNKPKVSPIKIKQTKAYNTSPILKTDRDYKIKVSPIKSTDKYAKNTLSHRDYQLACQTISTKLNTQRTPAKKIVDKKQTSKKNKKSTKQLKTNRSTQQTTKIKKKQKQHLQIQLNTIKEQEGFKKIKKFVPEINTRGPQRKQSYFDSQTIEKLNLDNAQFFRRKKHQIQQISEQKIKKNNVSTQIYNLNSLSYRQIGIQTDPSQSTINQPLTYRDLQSFRKQQQLKWKIVYLQLNQLKNTRTPQKIQSLIQQSHKNISQFQSKCKQITNLQNKANKQYVFESPMKVRNALNRRRNSQQQNRQLIKSLSDQRLLQQLQNLDNFQQLSHVKNNSKQQKPSSSSFCIQFQKQLQSYSQQNPYIQKNNQLQIDHIPQLQYQKSVVLLTAIQELLILQFCQQIAQSSNILHSYLNIIKKQQQQPNQIVPDNQANQLLKIKCTQTYSIDLLYRLFKYIEQNNYTDDILRRVNQSFGNSPSVNLRLLRNYFIQNQEDMYEDQGNVSIVIDSNILGEFQTLNYQIPVQGQYFYNHCVYTCFNQILDTCRPYSVHGPPPLLTTISTIHKSLSKIFTIILQKFQQIMKVKMGRTNFNEQQFDPIRITQNSYGLMDHFLVIQQQQKWKKMQQNIFEQKFFLAQNIINEIFNQEIMMIGTEFF